MLSAGCLSLWALKWNGSCWIPVVLLFPRKPWVLNPRWARAGAIHKGGKNRHTGIKPGYPDVFASSTLGIA